MDFTSWATLATAKNHFVAALTILVDLCNGDGKKKNRLGPPSRPSFCPSIKKIEEKESWQKTTCYSAANVKKNLWKLKNEKSCGVALFRRMKKYIRTERSGGKRGRRKGLTGQNYRKLLLGRAVDGPWWMNGNVSRPPFPHWDVWIVAPWAVRV